MGFWDFVDYAAIALPIISTPITFLCLARIPSNASSGWKWRLFRKKEKTSSGPGGYAGPMPGEIVRKVKPEYAISPVPDEQQAKDQQERFSMAAYVVVSFAALNLAAAILQRIHSSDLAETERKRADEDRRTIVVIRTPEPVSDKPQVGAQMQPPVKGWVDAAGWSGDVVLAPSGTVVATVNLNLPAKPPEKAPTEKNELAGIPLPKPVVERPEKRNPKVAREPRQKDPSGKEPPSGTNQPLSRNSQGGNPTVTSAPSKTEEETTEKEKPAAQINYDYGILARLAFPKDAKLKIEGSDNSDLLWEMKDVGTIRITPKESKWFYWSGPSKDERVEGLQVFKLLIRDDIKDDTKPRPGKNYDIESWVGQERFTLLFGEQPGTSHHVYYPENLGRILPVNLPPPDKANE